ncbi:LacI family transcriptional regulator [Arsukibacterium sp. MJ3]|jgi:DNA-binding LacI/PurR family transcriptional regulator|uniref:LacI family DNA-binding transcriptional regulator n=1 Tax=Arsukibacterium sp. MJ3 TaxID=1632859 RepID=UPI000626FF64|nr:LacI family DNA-binding transcriptional regulator [Arsukibacterium sp. MJ3]KKO50171.1 LacI family transcriptional regulator [Arsukibacterium sp. MJ3]
MKDKATSFDIAYMAGVSQSTVSRALRNSPQVNKETRERVHAIAKQLNYKVDKNASNLRKQRSSTLALLLFEDPTSDESLINPFFLSMLGSITRACAKRGQDLLVSFQQLSDDWHADYEDSNKADGIILLGYGDYKDYEEKLAKLLAQETHFVCWGAEVLGHPQFTIRSNNREGGRLAGEHLLANGYKNFAFVGNASEHSPEFFERYQGFIEALHAAGVQSAAISQRDAISTEKAGDQAIRHIVQQGKPIDAVFCASDIIAIGVMRALHQLGHNIPGNIAVMGFDDIPVASFATPALSTIQQDTSLAGELLVDNLLRLINNEAIKTTHIQPKLIIRQSCGTL